jgi:hypothetical protein
MQNQRAASSRTDAKRGKTNAEGAFERLWDPLGMQVKKGCADIVTLSVTLFVTFLI